ncbi:MAG: TIGR03643 family protein [Pseudomonadota bacterium]|nr:TIGR03643 family protein [Pseudomonadota bacterium]
MSRLMNQMTDAEMSAIVEMAWDDDTSFDAIEVQTGLSEHKVIEIMRRVLKPSSFRLWRKRVSGRASKHGIKSRQIDF